MIKVTVEGKGLHGVNRLIKQLPYELNSDLLKSTSEFMKSVKKSAKLRAPKDTKELKDSIGLVKRKNGWEIIANSPHAVYQEEGFKAHWIHTDMLRNKGSSKSPKYSGFMWVSKSKPFIRPALEHNLSNLHNILSKSIKRGIQEAK